jgi:hypothetical protein
VKTQGRGNDGWIGALLVGAVGAVVSLPAMLLVLPLIPLARWRRLAMVAAAVVGVAVTALFWSRITGQMDAAIAAMRRAGNFWEDPERALSAAWPHVRVWWLMALGLAPAGAVAVDLFRPRSVEELRDQEERRTDRVRARRERRARRAVGASRPERRPAGFELGRHIVGDRLLPTRRSQVAMPLARLEKPHPPRDPCWGWAAISDRPRNEGGGYPCWARYSCARWLIRSCAALNARCPSVSPPPG